MNVNASQYMADLWWLMPELWLMLAGFVLLMVSPFVSTPEGRRRMAWSSIAAQVIAIGLLGVYAVQGALAASGPAASAASAIFRLPSGAPLVVVDGFSIVLKVTILVAGILSTLMGIRFLEIERLGRGEFHAVMLFAIIGAMFLASGTDFITLFTGLETMSLSVYLLVAWAKTERKSNEAALKYFLLGSLASGILLYGMSLIYGATRSTNLFTIAEALHGTTGALDPMITIGTLLMVVAVGFKMAAAPFHVWSPDAYEGAPTLVTAFMSTAVKTAAFGLGLRLFLVALPAAPIAREWTLFFALMCAVSMTLGNCVALVQNNMKRLLAYSSIAHAGYSLLGLVAIGAALSGQIPGAEASREAIHWGQVGIVLYMMAYTVTNVGAFAMVVMLRREGIVGDQVDDFAGMARRSPAMAAAMTVFLLSLGGIPATAGFIGKWWLFGSIVKAGYGPLAVLAAVNTAISLYYYLRIVVKMYMAAPGDETPYNVAPALTAAVVIAVAAVLALGLFPQRVFAILAGTKIIF